MTHSRVVALVVGLYVLLVLAASFYYNIALTPDRIVLLLGIAALGTGRVRLFLKDWSIFLVILLAWQVLSGMSHRIGGMFRPHVTEMIVVDKALFFGQVPTLWLQRHLYHPGTVAWYDVGATVLYLLHFAFPIAIAFALWVWRRPIFMQFMMAFLILAMSGFATFVLFPAAPPWIAANWWHYMPHVYRVLWYGMHFFGDQQSYGFVYQWMWQHGGWDVFGAVPSEHAAFPFLCFLFARQAWGRRGWLLLPYCLAVWVAIVYLGEHYVADEIAGVVYASLAYVAVRYGLTRWYSPEDPVESEDRHRRAVVSA